MAEGRLQKQTSITSRISEAAQSITWNKVKESIIHGTLRVVGLEPTAEERRHWEALTGTIRTHKQTGSVNIPSSLTARDAAAVAHITGRSIHRVTSVEDGQSSMTTPTSVRGGVLNKGTGRNVAIKTELKPDLWKVAYQGVRQLTSRSNVMTPSVQDSQRSFWLDDEESDGEEVDAPSFHKPLEQIEELDEDFFGVDEEYDEGTDETDSAPLGGPPTVDRVETAPGKSSLGIRHQRRRNKIGERVKQTLETVTLTGGYNRGYGGLGLPTLLLHFKYRDLNDQDKKRLDNQILHKRPYFTYWLMTVQLVIMIVALAVYGFAPYSWDLIDQRDIVLQADGNYRTVMEQIVGNVWGGPKQQDLVLLGALYAPCMRWDNRLQGMITADRQREAVESGCCVRLDRGGCFQSVMNDCSTRFNNFLQFSENNSTRAVCGTSPRTCLDPRFPGSYLPLDVLTWMPICRMASNSSESHLTCEITARPCCYGVQAICAVTTREMCEFLEGRFHQDAFLCSQVDCLNEICGLLPFREFNAPDQIYRLWLALFLHAGLIHLFLSLLFDFFVLRHVEKRLGWWRTATIYILSGICANMVSAFFVPYYPEAGPAGSILGIVAYFFVFLIFESPHLVRPWVEALKLFLVVVVPLLLLGLLPFVDNFAHIGGLVFGFLLSGIFVPYWSEKKVWEGVHDNLPERDRALRTTKIVMIVVGIPLVLSLFLLFILLFYFHQESYFVLSYLNCVPFTQTFCIDNLQETRRRDQFII